MHVIAAVGVRPLLVTRSTDTHRHATKMQRGFARTTWRAIIAAGAARALGRMHAARSGGAAAACLESIRGSMTGKRVVCGEQLSIEETLHDWCTPSTTVDQNTTIACTYCFARDVDISYVALAVAATTLPQVL